MSDHPASFVQVSPRTAMGMSAVARLEQQLVNALNDRKYLVEPTVSAA